MAGCLKDISIADIIVWFQDRRMADVGAAREASITLMAYISGMEKALFQSHYLPRAFYL